MSVEIINGPGSSGGYRTIWHTLEMEGLRVPRIIVQDMLKEYFHDNPDAHRYVSSPRNQRIEGWWSFYSRNRSMWWRNFFKDLESEGVLDSTSELRMECLWYCYATVLQNDLNNV